MKELVKEKLQIIEDVWNEFIWDNKFCRNQINFSPDAESNYFGDILGYFQDTFDIIYEKKNSAVHAENFASHISFLQAIYVQQDFIEEMLILFKTGKVKGDLKEDPNYALNREIRNELVGHPFRKIGDRVLSTTVFGYERSPDTIAYLRYHSDNDFKCEIIKVKIENILERHTAFLEFYFDLIIKNLKLTAGRYRDELEEVKKKIEEVSFQSLIKILLQKMKPFLENTTLYDEKSILEIYEKRDQHERYAAVYDSFLRDLKKRIIQLQEYSTSVFSPAVFSDDHIELPLFDDEGNFIPMPKNVVVKAAKANESCHYELSKLSEKNHRNPMSFEHFSSCIKAKCSDTTVSDELDRMNDYLYNDLEYFCSYKLIKRILKQD
ncbi:hypothetical protein J0383_01925 [Flavobacterium endoglycinae]|uniref:Uncharacterized protein n=1 Tax=Flavobacterium endoglycinae TaxID=2816357 RepID=A0ABX7QF67_9FLAO|nr:hypothetical protein [Flavobacterium endoglycinae]QSW89587.1 hypothetical protein J0383_01925 [Flavobacterium endoglycinae]